MKAVVNYTVGSDTLQTILISSLKTILIYEQLISKTQNAYILDWLCEKIKHTSSFILDVQVQLETMDLEPRSISSVELYIRKLLAKLNSLFTLTNDEFIISECIKADAIYLNKLSEVRKSTLITDELYCFYSNQIKCIGKKPSVNIRHQNMLLG